MGIGCTLEYDIATTCPGPQLRFRDAADLPAAGAGAGPPPRSLGEGAWNIPA